MFHTLQNPPAESEGEKKRKNNNKINHEHKKSEWDTTLESEVEESVRSQWGSECYSYNPHLYIMFSSCLSKLLTKKNGNNNNNYKHPDSDQVNPLLRSDQLLLMCGGF